MCGFAGLIDRREELSVKGLSALAKTLAHRGPDDEGTVLFPIKNSSHLSIGLLHRRLSIIDLSDAGRQPMTDPETGNWIVYNGEIYNYEALHDQLKQQGISFKSHSDTEVLLKAYAFYGIDCLKLFKGMFAFAIWDESQQQVILAVDRFGIKPLYYGFSKQNQLVFASELRTLLQSGKIEKKIDLQAVDSYLAYGAVQGPITIIEGVRQLSPAHYAVFDPQKASFKKIKYWQPKDEIDQFCFRNDSDVYARCRDLLQEDIQKHLVSDVPVALFLSGGIDSSSVVAMANTLRQGALKSFSVTFEEKEFSEENFSRLIARKYCPSHTEIRMKQDDLLALLPEALKAMDQPTIDGINVFTISKAVREAGIKVVLSGQGGDEAFGGYDTFSRIPIIQRYFKAAQLIPHRLRGRTGRLIDRALKRPLIRSKVSQFLESDGDDTSICMILRQLFSPKARAYLMRSSQFDGLVNGVPIEVIENLKEEMSGLDQMSRISVLEHRLYLGNMLLRDGDFMSMAHGLEVRVPFVDHEILGFAMNVKPGLKIDQRIPKALLVKSMGSLLPREIYDRKKMGFTFPWPIWLKNKLRERVEDRLGDCKEDNPLGLEINHCRQLWNMFLNDAPGVSWSRVWGIYVLLEWFQQNLLESP